MRDKVWKLWTLRPSHQLSMEETVDLLQPGDEGFCCLVYEYLHSEALINNPQRDPAEPPFWFMQETLQMAQRKALEEPILSDEVLDRVRALPVD